MSIDLQLDSLRRAYLNGELTPEGVLRDRHASAAAEAKRNVFIELLPLDRILSQLATNERRRSQGETLPLHGVPFAVKDNIDVAGVATTAGCPAFQRVPESSAPCVERLLSLGAICFGKTNLDQFATGLVGTRSPYGVCRSAFDDRYVSGGSSSGSALAVALGLVSFALGTDTAGSGRVPAAFNNIVGLKPTRGLVSSRGVVPACRTLDTVSVFAGNTGDALEVLRGMQGKDPEDPYSREPRRSRVAFGGRPRFGVPADEQLEFFGDEPSRSAYLAALDAVSTLGAELVRVDLSPFFEAAELLYTGPWVAERHAAVGAFIESLPEGSPALDPTVRSIILDGKRWTAVEAFQGLYRLEALKQRTSATWQQVDALLLPTVPRAYTVEEVAAEPFRLNANLGRYTNFVNLLDLCGIAVPAGFKDSGLPFGVTLLAKAFEEAVVAALGARLHDTFSLRVGTTAVPVHPWAPAEGAPGHVELAVVGAHLRGQPLHHELLDLGAHFLGEAATSERYELFALETTPKKPGLLRSETAGRSVAVELYALAHESFGRFVERVQAPLSIGNLELSDGRWVKGFLCESVATLGATEISEFGGWLAYLERRASVRP